MIKKTNTLVADYHFISRQDSAVNTDGEDFEQKWQQYLDGMEEPPLRVGEQPTIFILKHLSSTDLDLVREVGMQTSAHAAMLLACAIGLKGAKNWLDGKDHTFRRDVVNDLVTPVEVVVKDELDKLDGEVRIEIGQRVLQAATPRPN